ncbi:hypothetical protein EVA_12715, partial [gut metagenome]
MIWMPWRNLCPGLVGALLVGVAEAKAISF